MATVASKERLLKLIDRFPGRRLLIVGDFMLDHFIRGKVERISPEAPVPVVAVSQETFVPGGAGNVAANLSALAAKVSVLGVVGEDDGGLRLRQDLEGRGVDTRHLITDPSRPTTLKTRVIAEHQQVVRFDRERKGPPSPALKNGILDAVRDEVSRADGVILSDYGKGVLSPEVLKAAISAGRKRGLPVVVDPKVEHFMKYRGVSGLTPNTAEAFGGMRQPVNGEDQAVAELGRRIVKRLNSQWLIITRGEKGMSLFVDGKVTTIPTMAREVFDVTGAGDTVTSVLTLALAAGASPLDAAVVANAAAGLVVGKLGTATVTIDELKAAVRRIA